MRIGGLIVTVYSAIWFIVGFYCQTLGLVFPWVLWFVLGLMLLGGLEANSKSFRNWINKKV